MYRLKGSDLHPVTGVRYDYAAFAEERHGHLWINFRFSAAGHFVRTIAWTLTGHNPKRVATAIRACARETIEQLFAQRPVGGPPT